MTALIDPSGLEPRQRYRLLSSLVVPRPIAWISTRSPEGRRNLAPFSYFNALSASPMLVGASIGRRRAGVKDTLANIRETGVFAVNLVGERQLDVMVRSSAEWPPDVDEFHEAGVSVADASRVDVPIVADAVATFECRLFRDVDLTPAPNVLVIGEVLAVRLGHGLTWDPESFHVDVGSLRPVGRLGMDEYTSLGTVHRIPRPSPPGRAGRPAG